MAIASLDPAVLPSDIRLMNATASAFAVVAIGLIAAAAFFVVARLPLFAIRSIVVDGEVGHNSAATIRANAVPQLAGNFFTVDLGAVRRAFESVPWVRLAGVSRIWPNRLHVRLEEHRAVALWDDAAGDDKLVNSFGEVFEANVGDIEDDSLPTLSGPAGTSAHALTMLGKVETALSPLGGRVDALALSGRGSWQARLAGGATVVLGRGSDDEVAARAARFVASVPQVTERFQRRLEHADLRHVDGYAVRLRGVATTAPSEAPAPRRPPPRKPPEARRHAP